MKAQSKEVSKKDIFEGQAERADYIISGIPKFVKNFNPSGVVFRHYTGQATQIILETNQLKTGINPTFMKIKIRRYRLNGKTMTL